MERTEIITINISEADLLRIIRTSQKELIEELRSEEKRPSDWEELTLEQAAKELNCCKRTLRSRMKECNIRGYRVGKEITLQRKDLKKIKSASERLDH